MNICRVCITIFLVLWGFSAIAEEPDTLILNKNELLDKIKGGWAGQTIGVTFGGPTEFRYRGTFIQDYENIAWYDGYIKSTMIHNPALFDDIYMDLTFVDVLERVGLDAPVDSLAHAFAHATFPLWHANQAARYNILNGILPPESGHWKNNPHADDIDYQIEADFAGLMSPGMPNSASHISDKIGHIMNYGDGWYGGVYVGAMYALAFTSQDIHYVVREALQTIPVESDFYKCIADVISWHEQYPNDWQRTWFEIQQKWAEDLGCPEGVLNPYNIDAKVNSAYVVMGLLYGNGNYTKTLEISTRAGQDSDCNPATAGGILGTLLGYSNIPAYWKMGLSEAEDIDFKYTELSLNKVYAVSFKHALEMIERNGGSVTDEFVTIKLQRPEAVRYEKSFEGVYPVHKSGPLNRKLDGKFEFEIEGTGFVIVGAAKKEANTLPDVDIPLTIYVNGEELDSFVMPTNYLKRKLEVFWYYDLPKGKHSIRLEQQDALRGYHIDLHYYLVYSDQPNNGFDLHVH